MAENVCKEVPAIRALGKLTVAGQEFNLLKFNLSFKNTRQGVHFPWFLEGTSVGYPRGDLMTSPRLSRRLPFLNIAKYLKTMGLTIERCITGRKQSRRSRACSKCADNSDISRASAKTQP